MAVPGDCGCYDLIAAQYDSLRKDPESQREDQAIAEVLRDFVRGARKVLDLGCGTGLLLELLDVDPEAYLGVDPSEGMLEKFTQKFPKHPILQKTFGVEDLENVDLVVSLFGPVSYVAPDVIFTLLSSGAKYFLMFYKQGYRPVTYDMTGVDFDHYAFSSFNLPCQDFGSFAIVTNLRMPCGSLAFPSLRRRKEIPKQMRARALTLPCELGKLGFEGKQHESFEDDVLSGETFAPKSLELHMPQGGTSLGGTVLIMLNGYLGSGLLVLPYAWRVAGWLFAVPFLGIALMTGFTLWLTGFLLERVDARAEELHVPKQQRDWGMLGRMAFGRGGELFFSGMMLLDLYGGIVGALIIIRNQMELLLPLSGLALAGLINAVFLLLLFIDARHFSSIAVLGLGAMLAAVVCLLITGGELSALGEMAEDQQMLNLQNVPAAAGMVIYSFMVHSEAPLVYQLMADRSQWTLAVIFSTTAATACFLSLALICYCFFGSSTAQSFPENLARDLNLELLPGQLSFGMSLVGLVSIAFKLLVNLPLWAMPILSTLESLCWKRGCGPSVLKLVFVLVTALLCILLKSNAVLVVELVGIVPQNYSSIVLPCAALAKLRWSHLSILQRATLLTLTAVFACYGIVATLVVIFEAR